MKRVILDGDLTHSTDWVNHNEQLSYWNEQVCQEFVHLSCKTEKHNQAFNGQIYTASCGALQFAEIRSESQRVNRERTHVNRHLDDHFYLNLQLSGQSYNGQHGESAILSPGDMVLLDTTRPFTMDFHKDFAQLSIMLPRHALIDLLPNAEDMVGKKLSSASAKISAELLLSIARSAQKFSTDEAAMLSTQAISLLANTYHVSSLNAKPDNSGQLKQIKFFMQEHLSESDLTMAQIASAHKMSIRSLQRLFQDENYSVSEYLMHIRLKHAFNLLLKASRDHSILDIAFASGFKNASHFSRSFKQEFGQSPKDVRRQSLNG